MRLKHCGGASNGGVQWKKSSKKDLEKIATDILF